MTSSAFQSRLRPMLTWSAAPQFITHQIGWWACVLLMGWLGPLVMLAFLALHFYMTRTVWRGEMMIAFVAVIVGICVDNFLHSMGAVEYVGRLRIGSAPLWLVGIWAGFGVTLRHHQSLFVRKWPNALLVGSLGGPLAYLGGVKLARFTVPESTGWVSVSLAWTIAMGVLFLTVRYANQSSSQSKSWS